MGIILGSLMLAWILRFFGFEEVLTQGLFELFGLQIGTAGYYVLFVIVGLILAFFSRDKN